MRQLPKTQGFVIAEQCDFTHADLTAHRQVMDEFARLRHFRPTSINWLVPEFEHIYLGGIRTIISLADYFRRAKGIRSRIVVYNSRGSDSTPFHSEIIRAFPDYPREDVIVLPGANDPTAMPEADAVVATLWTGAYLAMKFNRTRAKFYFVQDFEPMFYPSGTVAALAEATYRFGLWGIVNSPGLCEAYRAASGAPAIAFWPAVDHSIYFPLPPGQPKHAPGEPKQVVFYGRPHRPRNAFELGIQTLCRVKDTLGDSVRIVSVGAPWNPGEFGAEGVVETLGLLPTMESVAELYRHSDVGLVFMMTKHPSYQPLEYMACGCATVSNFNDATSWLLRDGVNCLLAEPTVSCVTERLLQALQDDHLRQTAIEGGYRTVAGTSWQREMDRVFEFMCKRLPRTVAAS